MASTEPRPAAWWVMLVSALAVGLIAGYGAVVFRAMIGAIHNLSFLGRLAFEYDANLHTPVPPWGFWIILVPVAGAIVVAFLVKTFAPEAKGHGVPEVMDAVYYHEGKIRPIVAAVKSIASAVSIGSGGSVGREGPIIQIGAAFGSSVGQIIPMPARQRAMLIAAGLFIVSLIFRIIDLDVCARWPIGTHFLWHALNAAVLYAVLRGAIAERQHPLSQE